MTVAVASSVIRHFLARLGVGSIVAETASADRAKDTAKIDIVPFVPAHSAFCRQAQMLLLCGVPFSALAAVLALAAQVALR